VKEDFLRQFSSDPKDSPSTETCALKVPTVSPPVTTENIPAVSPPTTAVGAFVQQPDDETKERVQFRATFAHFKLFNRSAQPSTEPSYKPSPAPSTTPSSEPAAIPSPELSSPRRGYLAQRRHFRRRPLPRLILPIFNTAKWPTN
jgi:hypothetical protein